MSADDGKKKRRVPAPRKKAGGGESSRRVPPRRVAPGKKPEASPEEAVDSSAAKEAAAQQAAAQQAAAQQAAAQQAAAKQAAAKQAAAKQAAAKQAAAARQAGAPTGETGKRPATPARRARPGSPAPAAAGAAARSKPAGRRGAPPRGGAAGGRRGAARENDSDEFEGTEKKSPMMWILGGAAVVLIGGLGVVMFSGEDPAPEPAPSVNTAANKPSPKQQEEIREERARTALDRVEKANSANPTQRYECAARLQMIAIDYSNTQAGAEAGELRSQLLRTWNDEVVAAWNTLRGDVLTAFSEARFEQAERMLEELPPVFLGAADVLESAFENEIDRLRKDAKAQARFKKRLDELSTKAGVYARKGYEDIAIAVIEALPEKVEEDAPDVWRLKEELIQKIQRDGLALLIEQESALEAEMAEARRLEEERKQAERIRRWQEMRDSVAWKPLLGRFNLYNWVASSDTRLEKPLWRVLDRNGAGVMLVDNRSGRDAYTGVYSNHWEDYVLEFELNLKVGALRISPRTQANAQVGAITDGTSPPLELGDDFPKNRWLKVTMEVNGNSVDLRYGDAGTRISMDPDTTRLPSTGGFVFYAGDGTRLEIRGVRVKLVNDTREGGIFAK
ncbi:MAG: hypothetical protein ACPHP7_04395 [Planctomycetota bacterium]